ncbi:MAG: alkaline phosphatase family protein, partial [Candidatus Gastranaerophilales bacterium]|nr:alkaline phosphatase family protein [Candidatus Gastranaerophilales bacterium]
FLYKNGSYHNLFIKGLKINQRVINFYSQLFYLPKFTKFNSKKPALVIIYTALTHEPRILTPPDYELLSKRKNKKTTEEYDKTKNLFLSLNTDSFAHYNVNAAAFILLGKFLNCLKENNVYDNSRIIIVSDHGSRTNKINNPIKNIDFAIGNNPVLFVKDFNAKGEFKTSDMFMTNADVAEIALDKVINNPINPYTNKPIAKFDKTKGVWVVTDTCYEWSHIQLNRTKPIKDEYKVSHFKGGDISKKENWSNEIKYGEIKKIFENGSYY